MSDIDETLAEPLHYDHLKDEIVRTAKLWGYGYPRNGFEKDALYEAVDNIIEAETGVLPAATAHISAEQAEHPRCPRALAATIRAQQEEIEGLRTELETSITAEANRRAAIMVSEWRRLYEEARETLRLEREGARPSPGTPGYLALMRSDMPRNVGDDFEHIEEFKRQLDETLSRDRELKLLRRILTGVKEYHAREFEEDLRELEELK